MTTELTTATFDEFINSSDKPVIVDFWAEWCGPCKKIAPIIDEMNSDESSPYRFAKLNIDDHVEMAVKYEVMSIPALMVFDKSSLVGRARVIGGFSKESISESIRTLLAEREL